MGVVFAGLRLNNAGASGTVLRPFLQPESPLSSRSLVFGFKCKLRDSNSRPPYLRPHALTTRLYTIHGGNIKRDQYYRNAIKAKLGKSLFGLSLYCINLCKLNSVLYDTLVTTCNLLEVSLIYYPSPVIDLLILQVEIVLTWNSQNPIAPKYLFFQLGIKIDFNTYLMKVLKHTHALNFVLCQFNT